MKSMNKRQEARLNMYRTVEDVCDQNQPILDDVMAFADAFAEFKPVIAAIIAAAEEKSLSIVGFAAAKTNARDVLTATTVDIASTVYAYAAKTGDEPLKAQMNLPASSLTRTRDEELAPLCQSVHDRAAAILPALKNYGIEAADLAQMQTQIDAYEEDTPKPRVAEIERKTITGNLVELFHDADDILEDQMDRLINRFRAAHPQFVENYENAREIIEPAHTTTQLKGLILTVVDQKPIEGAIVTVVETNQSAATDTDGAYLIKPAQNGKFTIRIAAADFQTIEKPAVEIKMGKINHCDAQMTAE